ncbi:MAG: SPOR domain-containing protein [Magnetospirillum sp. WYHS-4]
MSGRLGRIGIAVAVAIGLSACGGYLSDEIGGPGFFAGGPIGGGAQATDLGLAALAKGDLVLAERYFKGALKRDPKNAYAQFGMGVIYHALGEAARAREMYEGVLAQRPGSQIRLIPWNGTVARPLNDVATSHLTLLDSGGVLSSMGGMLPPMPNGARPGAQGGGVSGAAAGAAVMGRKGAVLPAAGSGGDILLAGGDLNVVSRFKTLAALKDQGLITSDEFQARRQANVGALLPLTAPPPAAGLDRPVPATDQIVGRLKALARSLETRNITLEQQSAERAMILDALVPAAPVSIAEAPAPIKAMTQAAEAAHRLEFLRKGDLVTPEEFQRERSAIEAASAQIKAAEPAPRTTAPAAKGAAKKAPDAKAAAKPAAGKAKGKATGPQHGVHVASFKSQKEAEKGWEQIKKTHAALLGKLQPEIRKQDLPKGTFWRLKAGPLPDKAAAQDLCKKLKAKGQYCDPAFVNAD